MTRSIVLIPARMKATRLPGKPLADIHGQPMIVHVWQRAMAAEIGRVVVATDSEVIVAAVRAAGGEAVMTRAGPCLGLRPHLRGPQSDRSRRRGRGRRQPAGRLADARPALVRACIAPLEAREAPTSRRWPPKLLPTKSDHNPNVVKVVGIPASHQPGRLRALYFTRATAPHGDGPLYHHIGIYAYRRTALERFVSLPPSELEQREKLEQLRALEDGMRIDVAIVDTVPLGVDTPADLEQGPATDARRADPPDQAPEPQPEPRCRHRSMPPRAEAHRLPGRTRRQFASGLHGSLSRLRARSPTRRSRMHWPP